MRIRFYVFVVFSLLFFITTIYGAQQVSGGFNLTFSVDQSTPTQNYTNNNQPVSKPSSFTMFNRDNSQSTGEVFFEVNYSSIPSQTQTFITNRTGDVSSPLCSWNYSSNTSLTCSYSYPSSWNYNSYSPELYIYTRNKNNSLSLSQLPTSFIFQKENASLISGGFNLTFNVDQSTPTQNYSNNNQPVSKPSSFTMFNRSNSQSTGEVFFEVNYSSIPSQTQTFITNRTGDVSSPLCSWNYSSNTSLTCSYSYPSSWNYNSYSPELYIYTRNKNNSLSLSQLPTSFIYQLGSSGLISGGFTLESSIVRNYVGDAEVEYVSPTPQNGYRKSNLSNVTVKVYDGEKPISNCKLIVNEQSYSMNYDGTYCSLTFNTSTNNVSSYLFKVNYTQNSVEKSLGEREFYSYDVSGDSTQLPAFGIGSFILFILILLGDFARGTKNKKALGSVVAVSLLIVVGVSSAITFQTFLNEYQSGLQNKVQQNSDTSKAQVSIPLVQKDTNSIELSVKNPSNFYYGVEQIGINDQECNINGSDVIGQDTTSTIRVSNCSFEKGEALEIMILTNSFIIESKNTLR